MDKNVSSASTANLSGFAVALAKNSFKGQYTAESVIVTLAIALALYNSLEMILLISTTFKHKRGLYFWSLSLCTFGVILYTTGMMLGYFQLGVLWLGKTILDIGWITMIACQSLVLYSRLGLIFDNPRLLKGVKWMIITTSTVVLPTVCILDFGTTYTSLSTFPQAYSYVEYIQLMVIFLQEAFISSLYVWKTIALLKIISKAKMRSMMYQLFTVNIVIIAMDILLVVLEFKHLQLYQESTKAFIYSVKLKLELNILSRLVDLVHGDRVGRSMTLEMVDSNAIEGQSLGTMREGVRGSDQLNTDYFSTKFTKNDNNVVVVDDIEANGHAVQPKSEASSSERPESDDNAIIPIVSSNSRFAARTTSREPDLYAEFLRDSK